MGEDIVVVRRGESISPCVEYSKHDAAFVGDSDDPIYFFGMWKAYVFVDSGTGPNERRIEIADVETDRLAFSGWYWSDAAVDFPLED